MNNLSPEYFFDLSKFAHSSIFDGCTYVWEALAHIKEYLQKIPLGKIETEVPQGTFLDQPELISIGKGTIIEPGAYIRGPCLIGESCTIRHGAYIRGDFIAGNHCIIGHDTEAKNTLMLDRAFAAHFAYLGDTILGNRVNLGAGVKCANLKLDHKGIFIRLGDQLVETGLRKFGAIIGDDCQLGCNTVTNPGTLLGQHVYCYPSLNIGGYIPSRNIVRSTQKLNIQPL